MKSYWIDMELELEYTVFVSTLDITFERNNMFHERFKIYYKNAFFFYNKILAFSSILKFVEFFFFFSNNFKSFKRKLNNLITTF